jgi:uncharacterized YigZ family protein
VPAGRHRVESSVRRSRFITTLARASDGDAARQFVGEMKAEFPDATHNCWAFVAGPPGSTAQVGMSDDGEPHGTAGRPMLNALLHGSVGEVVAVVTRYYGGVKLGKGGLGRAYAGGVRQALSSLPTLERVDRHPYRLVFGYPVLDAVQRLLAELDVTVDRERYGEAVELEVAVPVGAGEKLKRGLAELSGGAAECRSLRLPSDDSDRSA